MLNDFFLFFQGDSDLCNGSDFIKPLMAHIYLFISSLIAAYLYI